MRSIHSGVETFGTLYPDLAAQPWPLAATHAFALVVAGRAIAALLATIAAYRSSQVAAAIGADAAA